MKARTWITLAALAGCVLHGSAAEAKSAKVRLDVDLLPTGVDADARGRAKLQVRGGSDGRFEIQLKKLDRRATYEVIVDDVRIGAVTTSSGGGGSARFRSKPRRMDDFLGFDPRGVTLVIRNAAGADVLAATIPLGDDGSGGGDVVCCIPDDSGPECEDRTPAECAAEGGTVSTVTSCLPNPCAGTPPPAGTDIVCCVPDDSGPECEDRTPAECALEGGVAVEATSCSPNPCVAVPPSDADVRCCLADDSGPECEDRTPAECLAQGGVNIGIGSCVPNPCNEVTPPPGGGTGTVRVRCERRASRSKVSVDGDGLASGSYRARVVSAGNAAQTGFQPTVGDEAEFDFDSDGGDIAAGATAIAADFLTGTPPTATGQILNAQGSVIAEGTATCDVR